MARNPYILTMMIDVYLEDGELGRNRAELMTRFTRILFERERSKPATTDWIEARAQTTGLARLAYEMQERAGSGAAVETTLVKIVMPDQVEIDPAWPPVSTPPDRVLALAARANILEMPVDRSSVRFYHQLLQEYFAAREMLKQDPARLAGKWRRYWLESEMPLWERPERNSDPLPPPPPTGWEETTILAAGLASLPVADRAIENDDQLIRALTGINPVLAGRCLYEGRATVDGAVRQEVIEALLLTISHPEVALRVRIAAGEVLGYLGDPRLGEMVTIPGSEFWMGDGKGEYDDEKPEHKLFLAAYRYGQYPVTNAEFAPFIEAGGYRERRWWTAAGWTEKAKPTYESEPWTKPRYWDDARFNKPNQPLVGVSWYEAVAYCCWLSAETGRLHRLPTEAEWEKGARGVEGRTYPWGNNFDPTRLNADEGNQVVKATTPVGIYAIGVSPFGAYDCAGNVWEWCATIVSQDFDLKPYPYDVSEDEWTDDYLARTNVLRVLRGGSWYGDRYFARCAARYRNYPSGGFDGGGLGFRLVSPI
jgi:formylglycine-generating enzyme required for sulfatase activity